MPERGNARARPPGEYSEPLPQQVTHLLEECRMVLPGVQALFGFQLVAVFNQRFGTALSQGEQELHLLAIALVAVSVALLMAPAAYHRLACAAGVPADFVPVASRLLLASMPPLIAGMCVDFYLIAHVVTGRRDVGVGLAGTLTAVFVALWFVLPVRRRLRRRASARAAREHRTGPQ